MELSSWVNNHDLFHVIGRLWTLVVPLDMAWSLNLLCGLFGAITVSLVFATGRLLTGNVAASALGAVALMCSHSLWWHSTILEVYTLNTALLAGMLYLVVRYDQSRHLPHLYGALLCFGFGITNHVLMGLFVFAFLALFAVPEQREALRRWPVFLTGLAVVLLASQEWILTFLDDVVARVNHEVPGAAEQDGAAVAEAVRFTLDRATGGRFKESMFPEGMSLVQHLKWRANYVFTLVMNYPSMALPLGVVGGWAWWRDDRHRTAGTFFAVALLVQVLWSGNYLIWDMYAFGLPVWVMFGLLVILGADHVWRRGWRRLLLLGAPTLLLPPLLYAQVATWASGPTGFWSRYFSSTRTYRHLWNGAAYFANPNKRGYHETLDLLHAYERLLPRGAHILDDDSKGHFPFALYWQKTLRRRTDVVQHHLFAPFLTPEKALAKAQGLEAVLDEVGEFYASSVRFPERAVLAQLRRILAPEEAFTDQELRQMPDDVFIATFPGLTFTRLPFDQTGDRYIFRVSRTHTESTFLVEGESLAGDIAPPPHGEVRTQRLKFMSGHHHLQWYGGEVGDTLRVEVSIPRSAAPGTLSVRPTRGRRFTRATWQLDDGAEVRFDGFAPQLGRAPEELPLGAVAPGDHTLTIRLLDADERAQPGNAVAFDYLVVRPSSR